MKNQLYIVCADGVEQWRRRQVKREGGTEDADAEEGVFLAEGDLFRRNGGGSARTPRQRREKGRHGQ